MPHPVGWGYNVGGDSWPGASVPPRGQLNPRAKRFIPPAGATGVASRGGICRPGDILRGDFHTCCTGFYCLLTNGTYIHPIHTMSKGSLTSIGHIVGYPPQTSGWIRRLSGCPNPCCYPRCTRHRGAGRRRTAADVTGWIVSHSPVDENCGDQRPRDAAVNTVHCQSWRRLDGAA